MCPQCALWPEAGTERARQLRIVAPFAVVLVVELRLAKRATHVASLVHRLDSLNRVLLFGAVAERVVCGCLASVAVFTGHHIASVTVVRLGSRSVGRGRRLGLCAGHGLHAGGGAL